MEFVFLLELREIKALSNIDFDIPEPIMIVAVSKQLR